MKLITLLLPESHIKGLDRLVHEKKMYANRAQAMREAIRDLLKAELWEAEEKDPWKGLDVRLPASVRSQGRGTAKNLNGYPPKGYGLEPQPLILSPRRRPDKFGRRRGT